MRLPLSEASGRTATGAACAAGFTVDGVFAASDAAAGVSADARDVETGGAAWLVGNAGCAVEVAGASSGSTRVLSAPLSASVTLIIVVALPPFGLVTRTACAPGASRRVARPSSSAAAIASEPRKTVLPAGRLSSTSSAVLVVSPLANFSVPKPPAAVISAGGITAVARAANATCKSV